MFAFVQFGVKLQFAFDNMDNRTAEHACCWVSFFLTHANAPSLKKTHLVPKRRKRRLVPWVVELVPWVVEWKAYEIKKAGQKARRCLEERDPKRPVEET